MATLHQTLRSANVLSASAREPRSTTLLSNVRSEAIRLLRPGFLGIGLLVEAAVIVLSVLATFHDASNQPGPHTFVLVSTLEQPGGIVEAVKTANNFLGIVVVAWVAVAVAGDYTTGLIRLLVQAEPRRWRLMAGKLAVLTALTIGAAALATFVSVAASPAAANMNGISTAQWGTASVRPVAESFVNLSLGLLVWAALGYIVAMLTRSVTAAIAGVIGYGLVVESILVAAREGTREWLPGSTIQALIAQGNEVMSYERALVLALAYGIAAVVVSFVVFQRRDITS
jgi:ABC-2 type transport system permease protein